MSAFPPHKTIPSIPVSQEIALKYLSNYLLLSQTSPFLLPNARLESSGPTASAADSSIQIHQLKRVEAGLKGEWLAPVVELDVGNILPVVDGMEDGTNAGQDVDQEKVAEGWMDLDEYQREQSIEGAGVLEDDAKNALGQEDSDAEDNELYAAEEEEIKKDGSDDEASPVVKKEKKDRKRLSDVGPVSKKLKTSYETILPPKPATKTVDKEARKEEKKARLKAERMARSKAESLAKSIKREYGVKD